MSAFDAEVDAIFGAEIGGETPGQPLAVTLANLAKLNEDPVVTRFVNAPLGPVKGYDLDHDAGIVTFANPVGHLRFQGIEAPEMGELKTAPFTGSAGKVQITFAYEDGPLAREGALALGADLPEDVKGQGAVRYRFHALYTREKDGPVTRETTGLVDPDLDESARYPQLVTDDTLRLVFPLEEDSNLEDLNARAREIAEALLAGDQEVSGEDGEAHRLLPMDPSSVIGRVSWEGDAGGCRTSWTIGISKAAKAKTLAARIAAEAQPKAIGGRQ